MGLLLALPRGCHDRITRTVSQGSDPSAPFDAANDGKTVVFTVKIDSKKAVKAATMKYEG